MLVTDGYADFPCSDDSVRTLDDFFLTLVSIMSFFSSSNLSLALVIRYSIQIAQRVIVRLLSGAVPVVI